MSDDALAPDVTMSELFGDEDEEEEEVVEEVTMKDDEVVVKRKRPLEEEDEDDDDNEDEDDDEKEKPSMEALFGEEEDEESRQDDEEKSSREKKIADLFGEEEEDEDEEMASENVLESRDDSMVFPKVPEPPIGAKTVLFHVPKFLSFESEPMPEHVDDSLSSPTHSVARWRWKREVISGEIERDADGEPIRESNTRLVKWKNGKLQLLVGDVRFDVVERPVHKTYLFAQIKPEQGNMCMMSHAKYSSDFRVLPSSLQSAAHRQFSSKVISKTRQRATRVKEIYSKEDPEKAQHERAKLKDEQIKRENKRRQRAAAASTGRANRRGGGDLEPRASMSASFLEYEDPRSTSIKAVKRKSRNRQESSLFEQDDDEEDEDDDGFIVDDDQVEEDEEEEEEEEGDDDDEGDKGRRKSAAATPRADDDDDDDEDEDEVVPRSNNRARRTIVDDDDDEE